MTSPKRILGSIFLKYPFFSLFFSWIRISPRIPPHVESKEEQEGFFSLKKNDSMLEPVTFFSLFLKVGTMAWNRMKTSQNVAPVFIHAFPKSILVGNVSVLTCRLAADSIAFAYTRHGTRSQDFSFASRRSRWRIALISFFCRKGETAHSLTWCASCPQRFTYIGRLLFCLQIGPFWDAPDPRLRLLDIETCDQIRLHRHRLSVPVLSVFVLLFARDKKALTLFVPLSTQPIHSYFFRLRRFRIRPPPTPSVGMDSCRIKILPPLSTHPRLGQKEQKNHPLSYTGHFMTSSPLSLSSHCYSFSSPSWKPIFGIHSRCQPTLIWSVACVTRSLLFSIEFVAVGLFQPLVISLSLSLFLCASMSSILSDSITHPCSLSRRGKWPRRWPTLISSVRKGKDEKQTKINHPRDEDFNVSVCDESSTSCGGWCAAFLALHPLSSRFCSPLGSIGSHCVPLSLLRFSSVCVCG